ncbi:Eco57I restriction-modification methylase domain-containing protein [Lysobacter korlensis]|uniref:site-specific DNA-methyltransferase (adenine-specific) n=1 Tax=Lysobacter korlensis TaxID=553636 RepID=A0ABV6RXR1_9GAMM
MELLSTRSIPWKDELPHPAVAGSVHFGRDEMGVGEVQVAVASISARPTKGALEAMWRTRGTKTAMPFVVAAVAPDGVWLYGPDGNGQPLGPIPRGQAELQLQSVLDEPHGLAAHQRIRAIQRAYDSIGLGGFANHFLFATHHLRVNVPRRPDWVSAREQAEPMLSKRGKELITALGFAADPVSRASGSALVLRGASGSRRAIAVLLDESEQFDQKSPSYQLSPVAHGLQLAGREEVPWLIVLRQSTLRLYPGRDGVGVGQRGQSETFFELDLAFIDADFAGLLPLIFSADALESGGSAEQILDGSSRYAADLGARLRDRVYLGVVPSISVAIAERLPELGIAVDAEGLKTAYALTLRILFRLLFQAYGEDSELLPAGRNEAYDANSLQAFVKREAATPPEQFGESASSIWLDLVQVWDAIYSGNPRWEVPAYGGSLFDPATDEGKLLKKLQLPDSVLGPALQAMLTEVTEDGVTGAVDFRSLQVREFGTIYEGLLESSLSLAAVDLTVDRSGAFVPAKEHDEVVAPAGSPYFHSASGERKATGSYFTPKIVVDHLIERSVKSALKSHLDKVRELVEAGKEREAASAFWDFRVADLAMGSAHFLVAAVDKIERGMRDFLTVTPVPGVRAELSRLAEKAREALGDDIEAAEAITEAQLLRRQVARRCVYGLDINPLAVELSRLAIWIHTFVPGLPMSSLDHNLVLGNSLTGIGTIEEALDALDPKRNPGQATFFDDVILDELARAKTRLANFAAASEADKSEVAAGARLLAEAKAASDTARRIFDGAVAIQFGNIQAPSLLTTDDLAKFLGDSSLAESAKQIKPAHFPYLFPEVFIRDDPGFDAVIGNPPWEKVRWEAAPFWAKVSPGLMALPDTARDARIEQLRRERPNEAAHEQQEMAARAKLQDFFKRGFAWRGGTHLETAQLMLERALKSTRSRGQVGLVLPRQLLVLAGWSKLRERLVRDHSLTLVQARNHSGWLFQGVHASYAVVLVSAGPPTPEPVRVAVVTDAAGLAGISTATTIAMTVTDLESYSDGLVIPWFDSSDDRAVFDKLRGCPRLKGNEGWVEAVHDARWDFRNTGPDKRLASSTLDDGGWRVLMTRHVSAYSLRRSPASKQFVNDHEALVAKGRGIERHGEDVRLSAAHPRIVLRHPSRSDDTRTIIATALPAAGVLHNKGSVHAVAHVAGTTAEASLALLGLLNTTCLDWWARRFVDRHVTAPVVNNLPLPSWSQPTIERVAALVAVLLHRGGYGWVAGDIDIQSWADRAAIEDSTSDMDIRVEIEGHTAAGFHLTSEDLERVAADFSDAGMSPSLLAGAQALLDQWSAR